MQSTRRFASPLPTATAVVVAVLVAMASTLADAGVGPVAARDVSAGRVSNSFVLSSRVLATALASVAERLEEDWNGTRRPLTTGGSGLALVRASCLHSFGPDLGRSNGLDRRQLAAADAIPALDARRAIHRRLLNLPPPTQTSAA